MLPGVPAGALLAAGLISPPKALERPSAPCWLFASDCLKPESCPRACDGLRPLCAATLEYWPGKSRSSGLLTGVKKPLNCFGSLTTSQADNSLLGLVLGLFLATDGLAVLDGFGALAEPVAVLARLMKPASAPAAALAEPVAEADGFIDPAMRPIADARALAEPVTGLVRLMPPVNIPVDALAALVAETDGFMAPFKAPVAATGEAANNPPGNDERLGDSEAYAAARVSSGTGEGFGDLLGDGVGTGTPAKAPGALRGAGVGMPTGLYAIRWSSILGRGALVGTGLWATTLGSRASVVARNWAFLAD